MIQVDNYIMNRNRMIAEFMGLDVLYGGYVNHATAEKGKVTKMKYNTSWDWLMPVVEKIETTAFEIPEKYTLFRQRKKSTTEYVEINIMYDDREEFKGWDFKVCFVLGPDIANADIRYPSKLEAVWQAVVKFIEWYNTQNKQ